MSHSPKSYQLTNSKIYIRYWVLPHEEYSQWPSIESLFDSLDSEDDTLSVDLGDDLHDFTFDDIGNHADFSFNPDSITNDPFATEVTGNDEMEIYKLRVERMLREFTERLEKLEDDNKYSESQLSDARKNDKKIRRKKQHISPKLHL